MRMRQQSHEGHLVYREEGGDRDMGHMGIKPLFNNIHGESNK